MPQEPRFSPYYNKIQQCNLNGLIISVTFKADGLIKSLVYVLAGTFTWTVSIYGVYACRLFRYRFAILQNITFHSTPTFFWLQTATTFWNVFMFPTFPSATLGVGILLGNMFKWGRIFSITLWVWENQLCWDIDVTHLVYHGQEVITCLDKF